MVFCPPAKAHAEAWSQLGNEGWDWSAISKAMDKVTSAVPLKMPDDATIAKEPDNAWVRIWCKTLETLGYPVCDAFSGQVCGSMLCPETINPTTNQRASAVEAHLSAVRFRKNLTVITSAVVSKIILARGSNGEVTAEGVEFTTPQIKTTQILKARKEVVLAAGALNSSRILELSGIGCAKRLQEFGIDVFVDNVHVGENLQNHVVTGVSFEVKEDSNLPSRDGFNRQEPEAVQAALAQAATGKGPLVTGGVTSVAQLPLDELDSLQDSLDSLDEQRQQQQQQSVKGSVTTPGFADAHESFVRSILASPTEASIMYLATNAHIPDPADDAAVQPPGSWYTVIVMLSHPLSRGSVHITSSIGGAAIDPRALSHPLDAEVLARGLRFVEQRLGRTEPLASHLKKRNSDRFADLEQNLKHLAQTASPASHWTGSCAMMARELGGVVDPKLRVYGCRNLRVCDASVVPLVPRGNTQAVIYAVAEMGAEIIGSRLSAGEA